jgi:hypothetical protein
MMFLAAANQDSPLLELDLALVIFIVAGNDIEQRGFAGTIAADNTDFFTGFNGKRDIAVQRRRGVCRRGL